MALSPKEMHHRIIENLAVKTGHAFDHWQNVVATERDGKSDKDLVAHLKTKHGLGHYTAVAIVKQSVSGNEYDVEDDLLAALFAGKPVAKNLYKTLDAEVMSMPHTERVPCKTYVGYRAKTQFLIIAPDNKDGLHCGLAMASANAELKPATNFGSSRIKSYFDIGNEGLTAGQLAFIKTAYENNI